MTTLQAFLQTIVDDPQSTATTWPVLADWLEDQNDPRAELVRFLHQPDYYRDLTGEQRDGRVRELLAAGIKPVVPSLINSVGMRLVLIPAGSFLMGSPEDEGYSWEHPQHEVTISRPFYMGAFQVTQEQYEEIVGNNPSHVWEMECFQEMVTRQFPVDSVTWDETMSFCAALSKLPEEKKAGRKYRLPTEAQWEYACRGGASSHVPFYFGNALDPSQANFHKSDTGRSCPVGSYPGNAFGVCDMHGNVWEWCLDYFGFEYYKRSPKRDPQGPKRGVSRVLRGGAWSENAWYCRAGYRSSTTPDSNIKSVGFRVVCCLN